MYLRVGSSVAPATLTALFGKQQLSPEDVSGTTSLALQPPAEAEGELGQSLARRASNIVAMLRGQGERFQEVKVVCAEGAGINQQLICVLSIIADFDPPIFSNLFKIFFLLFCLCYAVPCRALPCRAVLCCAVLCYVSRGV